MKTFLAVAFVVLMALILVNRQRVFLRDPLATVYHDGVKQSGVQVFINYSDDVLLEKDSGIGAYRTLLQQWNRTPGTPAILRCMHWMACLTDADHATIYPIDWSADAPTPYSLSHAASGRYDPKVSMSSREVSFVDGDGVLVHVVLR